MTTEPLAVVSDVVEPDSVPEAVSFKEALVAGKEERLRRLEAERAQKRKLESQKACERERARLERLAGRLARPDPSSWKKEAAAKLLAAAALRDKSRRYGGPTEELQRRLEELLDAFDAKVAADLAEGRQGWATRGDKKEAPDEGKSVRDPGPVRQEARRSTPRPSRAAPCTAPKGRPAPGAERQLKTSASTLHAKGPQRKAADAAPSLWRELFIGIVVGAVAGSLVYALLMASAHRMPRVALVDVERVRAVLLHETQMRTLNEVESLAGVWGRLTDESLTCVARTLGLVLVDKNGIAAAAGAKLTDVTPLVEEELARLSERYLKKNRPQKEAP